jgi:hypothetical protein
MKLHTSLFIAFGFFCIAPDGHALSHPALNQSNHALIPVSPNQHPDTLQRYVGEYELAPDQRLTVSLVADTLYILPPNETTKAALKPIGNLQFAVAGEEAQLFFKQDAAGKVTAVEIRFGNGASALGKRK